MNQVVNIPNVVTALRFFLSGVLAVMLMPEQTPGLAFWSFLVFIIAAASDWVDGFVARRTKAETVLGKLMDPLADKVLVATALIMLIPLGRLPAWLALVILCREMIITGLRGIAASAGIVVSASGLGKAKSVTQYVGLATLIFPADMLPIPALHQIGLGILYVALLLTIWSGVDYFLKLKNIFLAPAE
ncbi:CDP-diacylglycerol--glycerol-3-phosphate 3-phosphatidyltransferase [Desulfolithobacter dissulfuricans]|uniref:CDP-diacylglycerol--glycerol-3-phosphate 3-phosphatidyltransferase n=1 Tax=Desulfolithobacter dissulfuricans TaxID=2795293 RepID=A0A915U3S5_9BACT|nr:CDP-diacylglycerol--glycerol-3-phosphate 3-phosphatidyltransferase [Desulfolithobacter dissulfuricans]BCO10816.1 CDP-diacylglycerol--glycerol-3-phosphate 3-phosphatidyltransferase [Desulfolithobacter dissulfuricans]